MKLNTKLLTITALFIAALMLLSPISQINTSGGGGTNNYDLDFLNSLDINNNNFVLSADSLLDSVNINNVKVVNESGTKKLQYKSDSKEVDSKTTFISISDVAGLKKLSDLVNDDDESNKDDTNEYGFDFSGYTIKLTKNLTFNDPVQAGESNFTPIGKDVGVDYSYQFNGIFDGQGHIISNLQVSGAGYAGLFGRLGPSATVKNLGIINSSISATSDSFAISGGIAGENRGTIENCYNTGTVTGTMHSGGIAGYNSGTIKNCYNAEDVKATSTNNSAYLGGIAGSSYGPITNCYNIGDVTAKPGLLTHSGGIVGQNFVGPITNCYNTGDVTATAKSTKDNAFSGGIVGQNFVGPITNCYNTGDVTATADSINTIAYSGGIAGYNAEGAITNCYNTGIVKADSTNTIAYSGGIVGLNEGGTIKNCYNAGEVTATFTNSSAYSGGVVGKNDENSTVQSCYSHENSNQKLIGEGTTSDTCKFFGDDGNLSGENKSLLKALNEWVKNFNVGNPDDYRYWMGPFIQNEKYPVFTDWYGEAERLHEADPGNFDYILSKNDKGVYEIINGYQLALIANDLNGNYVLSHDIGLSGYEWRPIGKDLSHKFKGTFDGQGYTISNLSVNIDSKSGNVYSGLFGYLDSNATVKDMGMINSEISATAKSTMTSAYSGGIAGYNEGTITNCYNTGDVTAESTNGNALSGGIAGYNKGTITNCYNTGTVTATANSNARSGGIAGFNSGTITNCYNTGTVTATANINARSGGIAGENDDGTITNCYNTGTVTATATEYAYSGGIAGENDDGTITNCYNAGIVEATSANNIARSGGIAGDNEGTIKNCYNMGVVTASGNRGGSGGIAGINSEMITNCYNIGDVTATSTSTSTDPFYSACSGGIAGENWAATITNCYNTGTVTATSTINRAYPGGIVGDCKDNSIITNTFYLESSAAKGIGYGDNPKPISLSSNDMKKLKLLGGDDPNRDLNKEQASKPWSPDIFGVNDGYPILADVPTQIDSNSTNKSPQSAVYITFNDNNNVSESAQTENYLEPFIGTNGDKVTATVKYIQNPSINITSYQWYEMNDENVVGTSSSYNMLHGTYYVKVTIGDYSYTSLTRTASNIVTVSFDSNKGSAVDEIKTDYYTAISKPKDPTRTNCKFVGWYIDEELTSDYDFSKPVTKDITLYAKWEAKAEVTVKLGNDTWDTFDGEVYLYQEDKLMYTLNGSNGVYSKNVDLGEYRIYVKMKGTDAAVNTNESINLTNGNNSAEVQYWTVTFDYNDNKTDPLEKIILNNSSVTGPTSPTRTGYTFEGWHISADNGSTLSNEWNFSSDKVTGNMTLYAKWKEIEYIVKYHANGSTSGTVPIDPLTYKINNQIILNSDGGTLAKSGHIFRGWNYTPNASSALSSPIKLDENVIKGYIGEDNILTLYAVWTPIPEPIYTLCLNSNDSTLQTKRYSGTYGTEVTLKSASDFGWNNECTFIEWNSKSDGSGISYNEGDKFSLGSETWNLYAIWSDSSYHTVSFDSNGGNSIPSQSIQDGYRASEPTDPEKQGHSFKHWSLNGTKYNFNQSVKEDITLKAEYEIISYKVTFYYNGDVYYSTQADYNTSLGDRMPSLPSDKDSWNTSENGKGSNFTSDSLITSDTSVYAVSENSITSILIIGGSAAVILALIAAWLFMRSRYN